MGRGFWAITSIGLSSNPERSALIYWEAVQEAQQEVQSILCCACIPCTRDNPFLMPQRPKLWKRGLLYGKGQCAIGYAQCRNSEIRTASMRSPSAIPNDVLLEHWYNMMRCLFWNEYKLEADGSKRTYCRVRSRVAVGPAHKCWGL